MSVGSSRSGSSGPSPTRALSQTSAFDESMEKVYAVPVPVGHPLDGSLRSSPAASTSPSRSPRARARAVPGADLGGGDPIDMGPRRLPHTAAERLPTGGLGAAYTRRRAGPARASTASRRTDGPSASCRSPTSAGSPTTTSWPSSLTSCDASARRSTERDDAGQDAREGDALDRKDLLRHGRGAPDRSRPPASRPSRSAPTRRLRPAARARLCTGCHGEHFSGGKIPGSPSTVPIPLNLTPDESGLKSWTYDDFARLLDTGVRKNGKKLDPFMPLQAVAKFDDVERHALWAYLRTLPPAPLRWPVSGEVGSRRDALRRLGGLALALGGVAACKRQVAAFSCEEAAGLAPDSGRPRGRRSRMRSRQPDKTRDVRGVPAVRPRNRTDGACGSCKVLIGRMAPDGTCKVFTAKPTWKPRSASAKLYDPLRGRRGIPRARAGAARLRELRDRRLAPSRRRAPGRLFARADARMEGGSIPQDGDPLSRRAVRRRRGAPGGRRSRVRPRAVGPAPERALEPGDRLRRGRTSASARRARASCESDAGSSGCSCPCGRPWGSFLARSRWTFAIASASSSCAAHSARCSSSSWRSCSSRGS